MKQVFSFLNKSYPYTGNLKRRLLYNILIGCFISLFLVVFKPFGLNLWVTDYKILKLAGFGLVSFLIPSLVASLMLIITPKKILEDQWKVWKEILLVVIVIALIAFGNLAYMAIWDITSITLSGYANILLATCLIGIFPVTGFVVLKYNQLLKINLAQAKMVNEALHRHVSPHAPAKAIDEVNGSLPVNTSATNMLVLVAENGKDKIELSTEQVLYIESADNYSDIIYKEGKERKKQLIRSSLKRMEAQISDANIIRCHRTFIVNLGKVKSIEGNAAGYRLYLYDTDDVVPVSRNYGSSVVEKLKLLK